MDTPTPNAVIIIIIYIWKLSAAAAATDLSGAINHTTNCYGDSLALH